jgi:hypothetical protein
MGSATNPPPGGAPCDRFRRQHEELTHMAAEILAALGPGATAMDATAVRRLLARFTGKLVVHAEMENGALYPRLLQDPDPEVRARVSALFEEVKRIYSSFELFARRWATADAIAADPTTFAKETREALRLLGRRLRRENEELYPLADARG